jgi:plasmid stability protein
MPSLNVRNLPEQVQQRLRVRAAKTGRSMEAEAREILAAAVKPGRRANATGGAELQAFVDRLYGGHKPRGVVDELICERREAGKTE